MNKITININQLSLKSICGITFAFFVLTANAQSLNFKAGLNLSKIEYFEGNEKLTQNYSYQSDGYTEKRNYEMLPGFHVGTSYEFNIGRFFSIEPGVSFSTKGLKQVYFDEYIDVNYQGRSEMTYTTRTNNIEIPILFHGIIPAGQVNIYATLGGYVGLGLSGKNLYHIEGESNDYGSIHSFSSEESESVEFSESGGMKRFDFGALGGVGLEYKGFLVEANYNFGLANLYGETFKDKDRAHNRVISISLGYKIKFKKEKADPNI